MNSKPTVLFVVHSWGGGTIRFACELADLVSDHVTVVWAWGVDNESFHISERGPYFADSSFDLAAGLDAPLSVLNAFGLCRANIVHTIGLQNYIHPLVERLGIPYDVTFTDYHHFSTAPHFEDDTGLFVATRRCRRYSEPRAITFCRFCAMPNGASRSPRTWRAGSDRSCQGSR